MLRKLQLSNILKRSFLAFFAIFLFGLFFSAEVFAESKCSKNQTQTEMNICAAEEYKKADEKLNAVYAKAIKILDETQQDKQQKALLIKAQKSWIKYRDLACDFETAGFEGGSIRPLLHATCLTRLTEQRTNDIPEAFMEWDTN